MSIGEVKAALAEAHRMLDQGKITIEGIGAALEETAGLALATLHDSRRAEAESARQALAEAVREVESTLRTVNAATENISAYAKELG
ncbi:hypothetical protein ACN28G_03085 [Micromonospora sp. WMMA1923]|uniref:hypothetical protein n=1 Tax=Micromonospora sp. WMMA1923 TaxID=3404125 RepID=UPI003B93F89F